MARFVDAIDLPIPPEQAFGLLADFSRLPEWDPGVIEARRLGRAAVRGLEARAAALAVEAAAHPPRLAASAG